MAENVDSKANVSNADEEIIKNLDLLLNIEVLEESDFWDDLAELVKMDSQDEPSLPESKER